jgi:hypothetical protein
VIPSSRFFRKLLKNCIQADRTFHMIFCRHVQTHASSLLIRYLLSASPEGLGFRRCLWQAHSLNVASNRAAERLGFTFEKTIAYDRVLGLHKFGLKIESKKGLGTAEDGLYRDSNRWIITWRDWEDGVAEHIDGLLQREVKANPAWH